MNNKLREDANRLEMEVDTLTEEIDFLQPEAERATIVESELRSIAAEQHGNVDKLVDLVKENEQILDEMRVCRIIYVIVHCYALPFLLSPLLIFLYRLLFVSHSISSLTE